MGNIFRHPRRRPRRPYRGRNGSQNLLNPRWSSLSGIQHKYRPGEHNESYRERIEELEGLSVLASVPGLKLDRLPALRDRHEHSGTRRQPKGPLGFNRYTLERFRDFIDATVLSSPSRTAIGAFLLVIIFFTLALFQRWAAGPLPPCLLYLYQRGNRYGSDHRLHRRAVVNLRTGHDFGGLPGGRSGYSDHHLSAGTSHRPQDGPAHQAHRAGRPEHQPSRRGRRHRQERFLCFLLH